MSKANIFDLINTLLTVCYCVYAFTGAFLKIYRTLDRQLPPWVNTVWTWTKWPALVSVFFAPLTIIVVTGELPWWNSLLCASNFYFWWVQKDSGDDDFTKKLKKKITGKVIALRGKLVVVPEPA